MRHLAAALRGLAVVLALAIALGVGVTPTARADDASEAQLNFELGQEYYAQRRYVDALERFLTSYRLVPNAGVAFNVAQVYVVLERPLDAYNWFETVLGLAPADELRALADAGRAGLASRVAVVEVTSTPAAAEIFVDRVDLGAWGASPRRIAVEPGPRTIVLRLDRWREARVDVVATLGAVVSAAATLEPITGTVVVRSVPEGATIVREDTGEVLGVAPLEVTLPIGDVRLRATSEGFVSTTADVIVEDGARREIDVLLVREASSVATLSVSGTPEGAAISVRGEPLGLVPFTRADLPPGTANIEISAEGMGTYRGTFLLEAGSATRLIVTLRPPPSWDWPLWRVVLYAGSAALIGGGAITGALAITQRDAFFANPTRSGLDAIEPLAISSDVLIAVGVGLAVVTFVADLVSSPPSASTAEMEMER